MRTTHVGLAGVLLLCAGTAGAAPFQPAPAVSAPVPPPMPLRRIAPPKDPPPGETVEIKDGDTAFTLFIPHGYHAPVSGRAALAVHFHGAVWFAIQERLRAGLDAPLVCFYPGEGSAVYRKAFLDRDRFARWLRMVEDALNARGAPPGTRIASVDVSSFSAGYGAVREILKTPAYFRLIRRIVLCDSMYAGFTSEANHAPLPVDFDPWIPFARAAARGERTFIFTHSEVPTPTYANSAACAAALIAAVGAPYRRIAYGSSPAASDPDFPLRSTSDVRGFHVWGYAGTDGQAHITHVRHMADVLLALSRTDSGP